MLSFAWPRKPRAQSGGAPRIGLLSAASHSAPSIEAFRQGLRDLGYIEGKNIAIESRFADGDLTRLPALAAELVRLKVALLVAFVTQPSLAAKEATRTIPIVIAGVSDPVGAGLVASLARPGGNITGTSSMSADAAGKSLEVLEEALPGLSHTAVLWNPANAIFQERMLTEVEAAGRTLGIRIDAFPARGPDALDGAFQAVLAARPGALLVLPDAILVEHKARIIAFAEKNRLPAMYGTRDHAMAGGLLSFGPDIAAQFRRAAVYVDRILKGAAPADLPVEQPTKFELVVNLKTAKRLGITIPQAVLARADEVIE